MDIIHPQPTVLPLLTCAHIDLPDSRIDCSRSDPSICVTCPVLGVFRTGGSLDDYSSPGHIISLVQWVMIVLIGLFGTIANVLVITIIKRQNSGKSFDLMLIGLACMDLIGSFSAIVSASATVSIYQNWGRGIVTMYFVYFGTFPWLIARSGSSFMTVLRALERYLVIGYPFKSIGWFTVNKTKLYIFLTYLFAILMGLPRCLSYFISKKPVGMDIPSLEHLDYLILPTRMEQFWYQDAGAFFDFIDFFVPLPLLLVLNGLVFIEIYKFTRRRKELNINQAKDIKAVKMFIPVVVVLFLCNIEPYVYYYYIYTGFVYREHFLGVVLSMVLNSSVNLPIYYFGGSSFRKELKNLLSNSNFCKLIRKETIILESTPLQNPTVKNLASYQ